MKIAYLILCHKNPEQVMRLIRQLDGADVDFYIHVDKKSTGFVLSKQNNLFLLPAEDRVDVRWATNSMVYATRNLIRAALKANAQYDYICLLSGQDFPIKSNSEIRHCLQTNHGANYIEILPKENALCRRYRKRNELYYPAWMFGRSNLCKVVKRMYIYLTGGFGRTFSLFRRKAPNGIAFHFGSRWWCLTEACLRWINGYLDENPGILAFFDNALTPDECVFQTLIMMSPFRDTIKDKLTFLEWDSNRNNPRILTETDFELLVNSESLFARKFDQKTDDRILDMLEAKSADPV